MQEVFEKIITNLETEVFKSRGNMIRTYAFERAIEIVKEEAEEYEVCYKDCGECEAYDKEKHHCPKFCKVITEAVKEIEENNKCNCNHKWIFQESQQKTTVSGYEHYTAHYQRVDVYFCEKCCEIKKIEQTKSVELPFGGTHHLQKYAPIWYQPKGE